MAWEAPVTGEHLRDEVLELAARHGVRVRECVGLDPDLPGRGPVAHVEERVVDVPPVRDARSYVICLHEVGHVVDWREGLPGEGRAWRFVLDRSLVPVDRRLVLWWWGSHVVAAGGDPWTGGCELVPDEDLAGYLGTWMRVAHPER